MQRRTDDGVPIGPDDRRERQADAREVAADKREQDEDVREAVLDRWERALTARALSLQLLDDGEQAARAVAAGQRDGARLERRQAADDRRDAAIERALERLDGGAAPSPEDWVLALEQTGQRTFVQLAALIAANATLPATLRTVLDIAADAFDRAAAVSLTLPVDRSYAPAASTADWATALDAIQLSSETGPLMKALTDGGVVLTPNLATDRRWKFSEPVGSQGARAVLSVAMFVGDSAFGALTIYSEIEETFDRRTLLAGSLLASQASLAITLAVERLSHRAQSEAWQRGLASRDVIGQAKGILMERHRITAEAAFDLLRTASQQQNTKVRDLAEQLVAHRHLAVGPSDPSERPDVTPAPPG